jgi:hypothetical protein
MALNREELSADQLLAALSEDLERTMAFTEQCRWHFSHLEQDAEALNVQAWGLFGKAVLSLAAETST